MKSSAARVSTPSKSEELPYLAPCTLTHFTRLTRVYSHTRLHTQVPTHR